MDVHVLAIQARLLLIAGMSCLGLGLLLGIDPATAAWRAALAGFLGLTVGGFLVRQVAHVIQERVAADVAERLHAEEQAQQKADQAQQKLDPAKRTGAPAAAAAKAAPGRTERTR